MARPALQGVEEDLANGALREGGEGAPPDILVVDDDPGNLAAIEVALGELGRNLVKARSGEEALRQLLAQDFALILLDVNMPGMDGFETARVIRERPRSRHVPIIFVTAYNREDTDLILRGYSLGAVDFLFKPIVPEVLRAKAAVFVELQNRTAVVQRQAEMLREMERRELERRMEEERQQWEAQALREENQRKDEFLAVLAHELRNPLSPLVTGLELIKCYGIEHDGLERVRESMERQVRHLIRLVDDLLDVSRISRGKIALRLEPVELGRVVHQAVESAEPLLAERHHELVVEHCDEQLVLSGDQVRLTQVVANLLHNAARYTDPGGRIEVSCGRDSRHAVLRVADNGRGIAPQVIDRIFDIFVQEREGGGGLGLGLTLVHRLVQLHGGAVRAYSEGTGRGSEFVVRLPLADEKLVAQGLTAAARAAEEANGDARPSRPLRIVVVEDQDDVRDAMQALLEGWGHRVESAADGKSGIELILQTRPEVALVDIGMPGLDGYAVARRVRAELGPQSPRLVAVTGFGREEDREKARRAGFDSHLTKPAGPRELRRVLRSDTDGDTLHRENDQRQGRSNASPAGA
ncbi:MAG TPA: response regulator [Thermoanaerobaculia bacterium]|jgi:signal transduction histidine kinase|nr:response regulator [Thermoanaerobaculia bacterium]